MTVDATEGGKIASDMAIDTIIPFTLVLAAVNREVHVVMVETGWLPGGFRVTILTGRRESGSGMVRIISPVVVIGVASETGIWCIVVVSVMAGNTIISYNGMCPVE